MKPQLLCQLASHNTSAASVLPLDCDNQIFISHKLHRLSRSQFLDALAHADRAVRADEKAGNNLLHRLAGAKKADVFGKPSLKGDVTSPDNLFKFQAMVMRELAEQEPCVFVGRAAGYVLDQDEEIENLVRIFVYADRVRRVQRVMEVDCISEERAKKRIRKIENERKNYYKYFTGNDWKNMKNYDLPINTTRLGLDETAELIKEYVKLRGYMK